ncbi:receptor-like protein 15 [Tripterygium wilfordii]|uniref:receptor-like protein 15 n=1 Tax=Tripterygium wilfordii TaxID=458696 RepID=UPI0018F81E32|nr:receptor-like protein 15 [Tripterygium wilfordii]
MEHLFIRENLGCMDIVDTACLGGQDFCRHLELPANHADEVKLKVFSSPKLLYKQVTQVKIHPSKLVENEINFFIVRLSPRLSNLEVLDLSYNTFDSSIISSLSEISSLKSLYLSENEMTTPAHKNDYGRLARLRNLELLDLSFNFLGSKIPSSLCGLSSLRVLNLTNTGLNRTIHAHEFNHLINLKKLGMNYNNIESFGSSQGADRLLPLSTLEVHNLEGNLFTDTVLSSLRGLFQLKFVPIEELEEASSQECDLIVDTVRQIWTPKFQLQDLDLSSYTPKKYKVNLPNFIYYQYDLRSISLSINNFGAVFPLWLFENNTRLEKILMTDNSFRGLFPCPSHPNPNLSVMDISQHSAARNNPSGNIPPCFINLTHRVRSFAQKKLSGPPSNAFMSFVEIATLDLRDNNFHGTIPNWIVNLSNLGYLHPCLGNLTFGNQNGFSASELLQDSNVNELTELNSLEVFTVAHNNLSGPVPDRKAQFGTLDESSYEANPRLFGPPLNNRCNEIDSELPIPNEFSGEGDDDSFMDIFVFFISFAMSYIMNNDANLHNNNNGPKEDSNGIKPPET